MTISLCIPYYEDPYRLESILYNDCTFRYFDKVVIVDDGSQVYPAKPIVKAHLDECCCNRKKTFLYKIPVDYGFNAHGARNLAACVAATDWLLFMDVDLELTEEFCEALFREIESCNESQYVLCNLYGGDPGNIFACRRSQFFEAGGYDEELRGYHMGDKIFRERLDTLYDPQLMSTRFPSNRIGRQIKVDDTCTGTHYPDDYTCVQRDQKHIQDTLDMIRARNADRKSWKNIPKITFDWRRDY